jgi:2'-5' RNA ligase
VIRTFIAIDIPLGTRDGLRRLGETLKGSNAAVSWVRPESIHLTLKFLGDIPPEQVEVIQNTLKEVVKSVIPFRLQPAGCGAFPSIKQMRIVWVGLGGNWELLRELQRRVEAATAQLGFKPEDRPFKPHLTIGRVKGRQGLRALQEILTAHSGFEAEAFDVTELVLYKSELRPEGARYTPLFKAVFSGSPNNIQ